MKFLTALAAMITFASCADKKEFASPESTVQAPNTGAHADSTENFFPVTAFILGDIEQIKLIGITPVRKVLKDDKVIDSAYVKSENYKTVFADFLNPLIDSATMSDKFSQTKFIDQSVDAITFSCDPKPGLDPNFAVRHWDVYADPQTGNVRRVYIQKQIAKDEQLQLTWQAGKWCRIRKIKTTGTNTAVISDVKTDWSLDQ